MRGSIPGRIVASTQSGVPSVPGKIPGGMTSCPTPVRQQAGVVLFEILRLYQGSSMFCLYQVKSRFCSYQVKSTILYTRGWCSFTHTSVRGAASAWAADTRPSSDCDDICVTAFVKSVSWAMTLVGQAGIAYLQYCRWLGSAI